MSRWSDLRRRAPGQHGGAKRAHSGWTEPSNAITRAVLGNGAGDVHDYPPATRVAESAAEPPALEETTPGHEERHSAA